MVSTTGAGLGRQRGDAALVSDDAAVATKRTLLHLAIGASTSSTEIPELVE
jgi:hypothetical protein